MIRYGLLILTIAAARSSLSAQGTADPVTANVQRLRAGDPVDRSQAAQVRRRAALALDKSGKTGDGILPGLIGALRDRDATVRMSAAVALGNVGSDAKDAVGPLSGLLKDDDAKSRSAAQEALRKITGGKQP